MNHAEQSTYLDLNLAQRVEQLAIDGARNSGMYGDKTDWIRLWALARKRQGLPSDSEDWGEAFRIPAKDMGTQEKKTPDQWLATDEFAHIFVMDPDGWNRSAPDGPEGWNTALTHEDFERRLMLCTIGPARR